MEIEGSRKNREINERITKILRAAEGSGCGCDTCVEVVMLGMWLKLVLAGVIGEDEAPAYHPGHETPGYRTMEKGPEL